MKNGALSAVFIPVRIELILQVAAEAVTFTVNGRDDFWCIRRGFEMFTNAADCYINGTVMRFQFATGHYFQQFCARLDFARILSEVKHGPEFTAWQFILLAVRTD